jgi:hypothetical protein
LHLILHIYLSKYSQRHSIEPHLLITRDINTISSFHERWLKDGRSKRIHLVKLGRVIGQQRPCSGFWWDRRVLEIPKRQQRCPNFLSFIKFHQNRYVSDCKVARSRRWKAVKLEREKERLFSVENSAGFGTAQRARVDCAPHVFCISSNAISFK